MTPISESSEEFHEVFNRLPDKLKGHLMSWYKGSSLADRNVANLNRRIIFMADSYADHCSKLHEFQKGEIAMQYWGEELILNHDGTYMRNDTSGG